MFDVKVFLGFPCNLQWCRRDRNLRDRDLVKISRRDRDFIKNSETETRDFKICAFCRFFWKTSLSLLSRIFFKFLAFFRRVLVVSYRKIQYTKNRWIIEILINHFFQYSKFRDLKPPRPRRDLKPSRPRLAKMGLETRLDHLTETKSRDDHLTETKSRMGLETRLIT